MKPTASIWAAELPALTLRFPGGSLRVHTAIVGAGLAGLSSAYHLLHDRPDRQVVVLEAKRVGAGASSRSTGMVTPGVGQNLAALVKRVGRDTARVLYSKTLRAVEYVGRLAKREDIDCHLRMTGQLVVARARGGRSRLEAQANLLEELDLPCMRLDDDALARTIRLASLPGTPGSTHGPAALRLPVAGILHPGLLLRGLIRCIHERQGKIYEATQVIDISKSHPAMLRLADGGTIIADEVVLATSGYTAGLGVFCGRILPVHLRVLVTEPLGPAAFQVLGWMGREGIIDSRRIFNYFRLTEDNRIVFGGGVPRYRWGGHTDDDPGASTYLDQLVAEVHRTFLPEAGVQVVSGWTGMIGYVLDAMPVIQRLPDRQTVVHVGGWCGHGIALSVASGAWVAHLIHHGQPPEALPWFRDTPPIVPCELIRWCSFRAVVGMMSLIDRL